MTHFDPTTDRDPAFGGRTNYVIRPGQAVDAASDDAADQDDPDQIKVEIEETRVELTATVDAI
jgi:hypothetical protein